MKAVHQASLTTWFADLIRGLKPSIVHVHHYAHMGLEFLRVIKQVDPCIRIFMTLHEYMAICRNNGQMVKTNSMRLCSSESYDECSQCFPEKTAEDFWLRKHYFKGHFELIEGFISPSEFLRQRYIQWGIEEKQIVVIENGQSDLPPVEPRPLPEGGTRNRFAFFGQVNPFKGIDTLLEALHLLPKKDRKKMVVEIHGANFEHQPGKLQEKISKLIEPLAKQGVLLWVGPYRPEEQRQRLAFVDWVLVPSSWWENSPMVIQEAFVCGRPVISSDIGGMAEKIRHNVDGLHVNVGNVKCWAETLLRASRDTHLWDSLRAGIRRPLTYDECTEAHMIFLAG
jgi:glycosyltransferase involved in cell wall biosynthesis